MGDRMGDRMSQPVDQLRVAYTHQAFVKVGTNEIVQRLDHVGTVDVVVVRCHALLRVPSIQRVGERNHSSATASGADKRRQPTKEGRAALHTIHCTRMQSMRWSKACDEILTVPRARAC